MRRAHWLPPLVGLGILGGVWTISEHHPMFLPHVPAKKKDVKAFPPKPSDVQKLGEIAAELDGFCRKHLGMSLYATDTLSYDKLAKKMRLGEGAPEELEMLQNKIDKMPIYSTEGLRLKSYLFDRVQVLVAAYGEAVVNEIR